MTSLRSVARRLGLGPPLNAVRRRLVPQPPPTRVELMNAEDDRNFELLLEAVLRDDSCCIDVGAGLGALLEVATRLAPAGHHIAFEPIPAQHAVVAARFPGVDVRMSAASDTAGTTTFNHVKNFPAYSGIKQRSYPGEPEIETISVRTERIDDVVPPGYVPTLLKIDVEGAEGLVLEGARQTIEAHHPVVVFEHGEAARAYGTSSDDIYTLLCEDAGLRLRELSGEAPMSREEFGATRRWNFVAHP